MSSQDLVPLLKQLKNKDQLVKGKLVLESNSVLETTYHSGTWNDYDFECCFLAYWNSAEVEVEIDSEQLLNLLESKNLDEIDYSDFESVSVGEAINPNISLSAIEWASDEPTEEEKEENDFEEIELYNNSDINECECTFEAGSVLSMTFDIDGASYTIDISDVTKSDEQEVNDKNTKSINPQLASDGITNQIGNQYWMTKNLDVATFRNGDPIPEVQTDEEWQAAGVNGQPACCNYNNDPIMGEKYGKLYNWHAVNDPRGLAPEGFHVPNNQDWQELAAFLGGDQKKIGKKLKATYDWKAKEVGTDEFGFSALPGGNRSMIRGFDQLGLRADWWSSSDNSNNNAWSLYEAGNWWTFSSARKGDGISVRCLKD